MHDGCERQFDVRLDGHFLPTCQQRRLELGNVNWMNNKQ